MKKNLFLLTLVLLMTFSTSVQNAGGAWGGSVCGPTGGSTPIKPTPASCEATFTGWNIGVNNSAPTVILNAVPDRTSSLAGFIASNIDDEKAKKGTLNPIPAVNELVSTLKIGDKVKIDFVYIGQKRWINKITLLTKKVSTYDDANSDMISFKMGGIRSIKNNTRHALKVIKGTLSWTFLVPAITKTDVKTGKTTEISDPDILAKIKQFKAGEDIFIDYDTVKYTFVIKDIRLVETKSKK